MWRYALKRCFEIIPTTVGVLLLTFALFHGVGSSPAEVVLGKNASAESLADFDTRFGYDKPLLVGRWAETRACADQRGALDGGTLTPLFPLPPGSWRLTLGRAAGTPVAARVALTSPESPRATNWLAVAAETRRAGSAFRFEVPAGQRAVCITAPALADVTLRRRTAHLFDSQFVHYMRSLLHGDLGDSTAYGMRVARVVREGALPSLALTVPILLGGTFLSLLLAMVCAVWRDAAADRAVLWVSTLLMSVNYVVWVLVGQYLLAYRMRLFPLWGFEHWVYLLLPVMIGVLSGLGRDVRFYRTVLLDEIHRPYVRTAIAKGVKPARVMIVHVLRNSLIPIVTYISLAVPFLFTGSLMLESFFGIPGLGGVSLNAIHSSDMAVVRAVVIIGALLFQFVNLLTDLCYGWLDPRVRLG